MSTKRQSGKSGGAGSGSASPADLGAGAGGVVSLPAVTPPPVAGDLITRRGTAAGPVGQLGKIVTAANRWRENYNAARGLTIRRAVELLELGQRGDTAYLQWTFRTVERRYPTLSALVTRCEGPLLNFDWEVKIKSRLPKIPGKSDDQVKAMADAQQATLTQAYDAIDDLKGAVRHLHLAEFRGYAHLQKHRNPDGSVYHLEPLNQWCVCRDGLEGNWFWNPDSKSTSAPLASLGQGFAIGGPALPLEDFIIREVPRPIDEIALVLFIRANLAEKDADGFLEIYGIPGGVVEMPPNVPQGKEGEYETAARLVAEGGSGAIPNGAHYTANDGPRGVDPFNPRLKHIDEQVVMVGTGGKLTMLAESGTGTLAGGAHADTFEEIADGRAVTISERFQRDFDLEVLAREHPGEPVLVYFKFGIPDVDSGETTKFKQAVITALAGHEILSRVIANQTDLKSLVAGSGMPVNEEYVDPYVPVAEANGALVTGEVVKDSEGDIVGGKTSGGSDQSPVVSDRLPGSGTSLFDPTKDIVAQRELWRRSLKDAAAGASAIKNRWVTINGHAVNLGDTDEKVLPGGGKTDKLKDENGPENKGNVGGGPVKGSVESAAHDTGRNAEASPGHDATGAERAQRIAVEQQRLKEWAAANGKLKGKLPREDARGAEHTVQIDEGSQRVIKATRPDSGTGYGIAYGSYSQGATPSEYLDRIATHNREFGDDVRIERVVPIGGKLSIVTSQPFIRGRDATAGEIDSMMAGKGYEKIGEGTYHHAEKGLLVHDLVPKNAKVSERGIVHAIDPIIQRVKPDFAADLKASPISPIRNRAGSEDDPALMRSGKALVIAALQAEFDALNARLAAIAEISDPETQKAKLAAVLADLDAFEADLAKDPAIASAIYKVLAAGLANGMAEGGKQKS